MQKATLLEPSGSLTDRTQQAKADILVPLNSKAGFGGISSTSRSVEDASGCAEQNTPSGTFRRLCAFYRIRRHAGSVMV